VTADVATVAESSWFRMAAVEQVTSGVTPSLIKSMVAMASRRGSLLAGGQIGQLSEHHKLALMSLCRVCVFLCCRHRLCVPTAGDTPCERVVRVWQWRGMPVRKDAGFAMRPGPWIWSVGGAIKPCSLFFERKESI
jgi:hypothetical protein